MHTSSSNHRHIVCAVLYIAAIFTASAVHSQTNDEWPGWVVTENMPSDWETAPLDTFIADYKTLQSYLRSIGQEDIEQEHWYALMDRAWASLQDEQFMSAGDWATVEALVANFGNTTWPYGDGRGAVLASRYASRLEAEGDTVVGDYPRLGNRIKAMRVTKVANYAGRCRQIAADWLTTHDLAEIPAPDRVEMLQWMTDNVSTRAYFSARFTGSISIPVAGEYAFSRYAARTPFHVDFMRVYIGDVLVLDTSPKDWDTQMVSGPVALEAGVQPIVVEYVYNMLPRRHNRAEFVLMWNKPGGDDSFTAIPTSSFTTSEDAPGLEMAFYSNGELAGEPGRTETIEGLQYLLSGYYGQGHTQVIDSLKTTLTDPQAVAEWVAASGMTGRMYGWYPESSLKHCTVEEVEAFVGILLDNHPEFVKQLRAPFLMMPLYYTLASDSDVAYRLIEMWGQGRERPVTVPKRFELGGHSPYRNVNGVTSGKQWMLEGMLRHRVDVYEKIRDELLVSEDGSCNLDVLKLLAACHQGRDETPSKLLHDHIQSKIDQLERASAGGDAIATWYVGMAINQEFERADGNIRLLTDSRPFELAYAAAESDAVRFWVFNEHAARLASKGRVDHLEVLIAAAGEGFDQPEQLSAIELCRSVAAQTQATYAAREDAAELEKLKQSYENLQSRLQAAQERGDQRDIDRYAPRLDKAKAIYDQAVADAAAD